MKRFVLLWAIQTLAFNFVFAQKFTISGYLKDAQSGESLIGANIYNKNTGTGTAANYYGFYSVTFSAGELSLTYSYVGYQSKQFTFNLQKDTTINIELSPQLMDEVVVEGKLTEDIQESTQMGSINVPIQQIKSLPAFMGEVDLMKVIQLLPGVQSGSEGTSGIYVRGGGPDQNLILLDGVPVYNASHLFGFFSVFNADAINNVDLIKGGFPARYGGRLSSVIDISMKEGNNKEFKGEGSIGLIATKVTVEGPLAKGKSSFIVSARRTYVDILARPIIKAQTKGDGIFGYYFYDLNTKFNYTFSDRDRLYFSVYTGDDKAYAREKYLHSDGASIVESSEEFGLKWGNITSALRWNHVYNPKLFSNVTATHSRYRFSLFNESATIEDGAKEVLVNQYLSGINDWATKIDFDYLPNPNHFIKFGVNAIYHTFNPGAANFKFTDEIDTVISTGNIGAGEFALYFEDDIKLGNKWKANAGLHYSAFIVEGRAYNSLQPRFSSRYLINSKTSLKASYARMTQYIHLLTNSGIGLPTDLWVPATNKIRPQQSHQVAIGVAHDLGNQYELSIESYYKSMNNIIEYKDGAGFGQPGANWQNQVEVGRGDAYGMEFFVHKKVGAYQGWVGYTLAWSNRQFDNINFGRVFPYKYDRRHDISITNSFALSEKVDFSAVWVYGSGNSISLPIAIYSTADNEYDYYNSYDNIEHYEGRNSYRMRAYHRLDLSVGFKKPTRWGERKWIFAVYNAYNRKNPFFISTGYDSNNQKKFVQYSLFPIIPSFSYQFKF